MTANLEKLWLQDTLNRTAINRALTLIENTGMALPCKVKAVSGSIVTVEFQVDSTPLTLPNVTIPKAESPWVRMPTQVGDYGMTVAATAYISTIAGLGTGTPTLSRPANLGALLFVPVSNKSSPPVDQNAAQIQGPNGAIIQTTTGTTSKVVTDQNGTTVTYGSNTISIDSSAITLTAGGKTLKIDSSGITLDGTLWETHVHTGVTSGSSDTGPIP